MQTSGELYSAYSIKANNIVVSSKSKNHDCIRTGFVKRESDRQWLHAHTIDKIIILDLLVP